MILEALEKREKTQNGQQRLQIERRPCFYFSPHTNNLSLEKSRRFIIGILAGDLKRRIRKAFKHALRADWMRSAIAQIQSPIPHISLCELKITIEAVLSDLFGRKVCQKAIFSRDMQHLSSCLSCCSNNCLIMLYLLNSNWPKIFYLSLALSLLIHFRFLLSRRLLKASFVLEHLWPPFKDATCDVFLHIS